MTFNVTIYVLCLKPFVNGIALNSAMCSVIVLNHDGIILSSSF
jgi:hypothetical protein